MYLFYFVIFDIVRPPYKMNIKADPFIVFKGC